MVCARTDIRRINMGVPTYGNMENLKHFAVRLNIIIIIVLLLWLIMNRNRGGGGVGSGIEDGKKNNDV